MKRVFVGIIVAICATTPAMLSAADFSQVVNDLEKGRTDSSLYETLRLVTTPMKPEILSNLKEVPLERKGGLVWALAKLESIETTSTVYAIVTDDYRNRELSRQEERAIKDSLCALGFVAHKNDSALRLLIEGSKRGHWEERVNFSLTEPKSASQYYFPTSYSIRALGIAGRPESMMELERIKATGDDYFLSVHAANIVEAHFYNAHRRDFGEESLLKLVVDGDRDEEQNWRRWTETEEYKAIYEWYYKTITGKNFEELRVKLGYSH